MTDNRATEIVGAVSRSTGIPAAMMLGRSTERSVSFARHLAMYLLGQSGVSGADIGRLFNRDHSSVRSGQWRIAGEVLTRDDTAFQVAELRDRLFPPLTECGGESGLNGGETQVHLH